MPLAVTKSAALPFSPAAETAVVFVVPAFTVVADVRTGIVLAPEKSNAAKAETERRKTRRNRIFFIVTFLEEPTRRRMVGKLRRVG